MSHVCNEHCRENARRLRAVYSLPWKPSRWREWVGAVMGGISIFAVAYAFAFMAGIGQVTR